MIAGRGGSSAATMMENPGGGWQDVGGGPEVLETLRALGPAEVSVRFGIGVGHGFHVDVPAASLMLQGRLQLVPDRDRFGIEVAGWGEEGMAWFALRRGRGRPDYWQGAVEHRPAGRPVAVFYFTAPLGGIHVRARRVDAAGSPEATHVGMETG